VKQCGQGEKTYMGWRVSGSHSISFILKSVLRLGGRQRLPSLADNGRA
jgi:hypothetical protein